MKIGLFTIFRCVNYGAILQATALKYVLQKKFIGSRIDIVNHYMDKRDNHLLGKVSNPNTPWLQRWRNKRKFKKRFHSPELFERRRAKTISLIKSTLNPTARVFKNPSELRELPEYDVVVVGSDQVWNPVLNHDFSVNQYLCSTIPDSQRRVSYAASFGLSELPEKLKEEYRVALSHFDKITVREESGAKICESLLGFTPSVVLDPTMLLTKDEWLSIVGATEVSENPYLLSYWVRSMTQSDVDSLSEIARKKKCFCKLMSAGPLPRLSFPANIIPLVDSDPFDFVQMISGAVGVVTDSFHGLQFAVNFSKPVLVLCELSNKYSKSSRMIDFSARYGNVSACADIETFRSKGIFELTTGFDVNRLKEDRMRSMSILQEIVQI